MVSRVMITDPRHAPSSSELPPLVHRSRRVTTFLFDWDTERPSRRLGPWHPGPRLPQTTLIAGAALAALGVVAGGLVGTVVESPGPGPNERNSHPAPFLASADCARATGSYGCAPAPRPAGAFTEPRWSNATSTVGSGPPCREGAAVTFSSQLGLLVVFGGIQSGCAGEAPRYLNDTWVYFGGHWRNATPLAGPNPPARAWAGLADDPRASDVVLFGGNGPVAALNDTWTFNGTAWSNRSATVGPSPRSDPSLSYSGSLSAVVLFGGALDGTTSTPGNDTWTFIDGTWSNRSTLGAASPVAASGASFAYDPTNGQLILFGGRAANGSVLNETWSYGSTGWTARSTPTAPAGRADAGFAFDPYLDEGVLFGGCPATGCAAPYQDTWFWNGTAWKEATFAASNPPTGPEAAELVADPAGGYELLLADEGGPTTGTWLFGAPVIAAFTAQPSAFDLGGATTLNANVSTNGIPLGYSLEGLPPGCASADAPSLVCQPTALGTFRITLVVATTQGYTTNASLVLAVNPEPAIASALAVPSRVTVGIPLTLSVVVGGGTPPFSYAYFGLPAGCLSRDVASLVCAPTAAGSYAVGVEVTDADGVGVWGTLDVQVDGVPAIASAEYAPAIVDVGQPVELRVATANGSPPFSYSFLGLPGGCQTPAPPLVNCTVVASGDFETLVEVHDAFGVTAFGNATLTVNPLPAISAIQPQSGLPTVGQRFSLLTQVSGGTAPLHVAYGGLPPGCTSTDSLELNCTPSTSGSFVLTVRVTDATGAVARANWTLNVSTAAGGPDASGGAWSLPAGFGFLAITAIAAAALASMVTARLSRRRPVGTPGTGEMTAHLGPSGTGTKAIDPLESEAGFAAGTGPPALAGESRPPSAPIVVPVGPLSEQILLHLMAQGVLSRDAVAPRALTQEGISEALGRPQSSFARVLQRLNEQGLLEVQTRHVRGVARRRKVYVLTPRGREVAKEVRLSRSRARRAEGDLPRVQLSDAGPD